MMIKSLSDKEKDEKLAAEVPAQASDGAPSAAAQTPAPNLSQASFGAYGPTNKAVDLSEKSWEQGQKPWNSTLKGRLAIRAVSRGIMGAAFFAVGGALTEKWLHKVPNKYDASVGLLEQSNPLQFIAKLIDMTAGEGIKTTVNMLGYDGERAVRFRPTKFGAMSNIPGRTLGHEVTSITFDFFCASVGDAWGRDIAGWFDPSVKKTWKKENGSIDIPEAIKSASKYLVQYVTYNGGEDWAVAIPYAYYMRFSREMLNHADPGFVNDPDRNLNGGSFRVGRHGNVYGNYHEAGIVDLQGRFTVYNMGTLMYRELYTHIADRLAGRKTSLYGSPEQEKPGLLGGVANVAKWVARSVIKAGIYMTPAVPFFWLSRTPQTKYRGTFIFPNHGMLGYTSPGGKREIVKANEPIPAGSTVYFTRYDREHTHLGDYAPEARARYDGDFIQSYHAPVEQFGDPARIGKGFDPYGKTFGPIDWTLNEVGRVNYAVGKTASDIANQYNDTALGTRAREALGLKTLGGFAHSMTNASLAYTPYMIAKAEFANLWDSGKMDVSLERMIDGAAALNWGEFKSGASEVVNSVLHKPLADPAREAEAQHRIALDNSLSAGLNIGSQRDKNQNNPDVAAHKAHNLSWQERVVAGKTESKDKDNKVEAVGSKAGSHVEQEALRKALDELTPPTNSVH
ncbi:MAG: hypothetical protein SFT92_01500 [Rickettsiales bacterium]|nr:hypothetical protein [Rickettsiales bacterium]